MSFNVTFLDRSGHVTFDQTYNVNLVNSQQFHDYVSSQPILFPLTGNPAVTLNNCT